MSRTVITGGAGFLGSHFCDYLLSRGDEVICFDNLLTGSMSNIEHITSDTFSFVKHDINESLFVEGEVDYVLNFASPASPIDYLNHPLETLQVGSQGTKNALELAKEKNAVFLMASTSEVYGDPLVHPQPEDYWGNVNTVGPRGVYDEAKRFSEALTLAYHTYHKVETRIVRIFNTFGPRMRIMDGRAVPNFINQALNGKPLTVYGDGSQTRSFCFVSDLVEGIYRLLLSNEYYPVNVGNPAEMSILELAEQIIKDTQSSSKIEFKELPVDDPKVRKPDITKAKRILDWEPKISLQDGLKRTISYFKEHEKKN